MGDKALNDAVRNRPVVGILLMLFSMSCIGIVDAFGKQMMDRIPQLQLVGGYFAVIVLLAAAYRRSSRLVDSRHWALSVRRCWWRSS